MILQDYAIALIRDVNSGFYLFDSHSRNSLVMPDQSGIVQLEEYLNSLSHKLNSLYYEIVPVKFNLVSVETENEKKMRLKNDRERKRKMLVATETRDN